ncbi:keratin, type I cytoskeletal 10-like [Pomacea canaliculata]|uniref:keratin, type I cytoskeletal 10-like n=1 Tax=Pomacea canaliculata TaxID=400727 RepID=UPI000D73FB97|nr:keratin, type I cytoskeletal 10-like [Pomacea canaliculata]
MLLFFVAVTASVFLGVSSQMYSACMSQITCAEGFTCMYVRSPQSFYMRPACVQMDADCQTLGGYDLTDVGNVKRQIGGQMGWMQAEGECNSDSICTYMYNLGGGFYGGSFGGGMGGGGISGGGMGGGLEGGMGGGFGGTGGIAGGMEGGMARDHPYKCCRMRSYSGNLVTRCVQKPHYFIQYAMG